MCFCHLEWRGGKLRKPRAAITFPVQISRSLITFHVSRSRFNFTFTVHVSSLPSGASFHTFAILFASRDAGTTCAPPSIPYASKTWLHGQATARTGERIMYKARLGHNDEISIYLSKAHNIRIRYRPTQGELRPRLQRTISTGPCEG